MMKEWLNPEMIVMEISETENETKPKEGADGPWTQIDGQWMYPGNGSLTV